MRSAARARRRIMHRVSAAIMLGIFFVHLVYMAIRVSAGTGRLSTGSGPTSLVPRWKDLWDLIAMFKWFFGKGPRPVVRPLDLLGEIRLLGGVLGHGDHRRQRHDAVVQGQRPRRSCPGGCSTSPRSSTARRRFLAAVFLFTVHFFNNHFRPDKLPPPDIVMFTGTVSLEEFRREHTAGIQAAGRNRASLRSTWSMRRRGP